MSLSLPYLYHKPPASLVLGVTRSVLVGRVGEGDSTAGRSSEKRRLATRMRMEHPKVLKHLLMRVPCWTLPGWSSSMAKRGPAPPSSSCSSPCRGVCSWPGKSRGAEQFVYIWFFPSIFSWVLAGEMKHIHGWEQILPLLSLCPGCKIDVFDNLFRCPSPVPGNPCLTPWGRERAAPSPSSEGRDRSWRFLIPCLEQSGGAPHILSGGENWGWRNTAHYMWDK